MGNISSELYIITKKITCQKIEKQKKNLRQQKIPNSERKKKKSNTYLSSK